MSCKVIVEDTLSGKKYTTQYCHTEDFIQLDIKKSSKQKSHILFTSYETFHDKMLKKCAYRKIKIKLPKEKGEVITNDEQFKEYMNKYNSEGKALQVHVEPVWEI